MKFIDVSMSTLALVAVAGIASAQDILIVSSAAAEGDGSLRAALETASASDTPTQIALIAANDIEITSTLTYSGLAPLTIVGQGQTIIATVNVTLLAATNGADLHVTNLSFEGPGGFSIDARGDTDGPAGKGIFVDVRDDQTGTVRLELDNVAVRNTAGHGVHISDCTLADDCGGGEGGAGEGSTASIDLRLSRVTVDSVGQGRFDADGVRIDERGPGDIRFTATGSTFTRVGADGVELDEGQSGDVIVRVSGSAFTANGDYCDPTRLVRFLPDTPEAEFDEGVLQEANVPGPITGTPDDGCFERDIDFYDDGSVEEYEFAIDVDDGFDVDEAGAGSIHAMVAGSVIAGNLDEGLDFDEEDAGGIEVTLIGLTGDGNTDDAFKHSEEDSGGISALVIGGKAINNGGVGFVFEEEDGGDVTVAMSGTETVGNDDGDTGLEVVQEDEGKGSLILEGVSIADGQEIEGVEITTN